MLTLESRCIPAVEGGALFLRTLPHVDPRWSSGLSRQLRSWMRKVVGSNPGDGSYRTFVFFGKFDWRLLLDHNWDCYETVKSGLL